MVSFIKKCIYGKWKFQPFFQKLFTIALGGLNFGNFNFNENGESFALKWISNQLRSREQVVIFDIGANQGQYLSEIDKCFSGNTTVHCFEPSPAAFECLSRQKVRNVQVKLNAFGLSDQHGTSVLHCCLRGGTGSSLFELNHKDADFAYDQTESIVLKTTDEYCDHHRIERVDFMKVDTEGNDFFVLRGAERLLTEGKVLFIQFEFGDKMVFSKSTFFDFYRFLTERGYKIYRLLQDGLCPVERYSAKHEIYIGANYLAVLGCFESDR